ncbi:MAG TPA: hypothetical protein DDW49_10500 [Deltaproteobacteria bacterium]|nr:hypothetical protein [Deltaproteobacteria bacterium]
MDKNEISLQDFNKPGTVDVYEFLHFFERECPSQGINGLDTFTSNETFNLGDSAYPVNLDRNHDKSVDQKDYDVFLEGIGDAPCTEKFKIKITSATYVRADTYIRRHVLETKVFPSLKEIGSIPIPDKPNWDQDANFKTLEAFSRNLEFYEFENFFKIFSSLVKNSVFKGLGDLNLSGSVPLQKLWALFHDLRICPEDSETANLPILIKSVEDLDKLKAVLSLVDKNYDDLKFFSSSHAFLRDAMDSNPPLTPVQFRERLGRHFWGFTVNNNYFDQVIELMDPSHHQTFYDVLSDPSIPLDSRTRLAHEAIAHFHQITESREFSSMASIMAECRWIKTSEAVNGIRTLFIDALLKEGTDRSNEVARRLTTIESIWDVFGEPWLHEEGEDITDAEAERVFTSLLQSAQEPNTPFLVKCAVYFGIMELNFEPPPSLEGKQILKKGVAEASRFLSLQRISFPSKPEKEDLDESQAREQKVLLAKEKAFILHLTRRIAEEGYAELHDLFQKHYGWKEPFQSRGGDFSQVNELVDTLLAFFKVLSENPGLVDLLKTGQAHRAYGVFKKSLGPLWASNIYEFGEFLKLSRAEQDKTIGLYRRLERHFDVELSEVDSLKYLAALGGMNTKMEKTLYGLKPSMAGGSRKVPASTLHFYAFLASREELARDSVTRTLVPWLKTKGIIKGFRPHDIPAILYLQDELAKHGLQPEALWNDAKKYSNSQLDLNDFIFYVANRHQMDSKEKLLGVVRQAQFEDVHRNDGNFAFYKKNYGKWENFSAIDLIKIISFVAYFLKNDENRKKLGTALNYKREIGFAPLLVVTGGRLERFIWDNPFADIVYDGLYQMPFEHSQLDSLSMALIHTHPAIGYEGPSAGVSLLGFAAIPGGDIHTGRDGFVVSVMPHRRFAVHFYDTEQNVICLGVYAAD